MKQLTQRRSMGIAGVMLLLASLFVVIAGPAAAIVDGNCNEQGGWDQNVASGPWGTITNNGDGSVSVDLNPGYSLTLCVKGGRDHNVFDVDTEGVSGPYWPPANCGQGQNQCGLSHWAIRDVTFEQPTTTAPEETTTTSEPEEPTTTTSEPEEPTTTTSEPEQSTTTTSEPEQSTTTSTTKPEETTTTTRVEETTTTTVREVTTTSLETTTSTLGVAVAGIQVEAPVAAQVTQATLPFTGISSAGLAVIAVALAGLGVMALGLAKRTEDRAGVRSW